MIFFASFSSPRKCIHKPYYFHIYVHGICSILRIATYFFYHNSSELKRLGKRSNWQLRHDVRQGNIPRNGDVYRAGKREINQWALGSNWWSEWRHRDKNVIANNVFTITQRCLELSSREISRTFWARSFITLFTRINYGPCPYPVEPSQRSNTLLI